LSTPPEKIGEPLKKETKLPFSSTRVGDPEFSSKIELVKTLPLSEPGEFIELEVLENDKDLESSIFSKSFEESITSTSGTSKKRRQIPIEKLFLVN
jgi:hypothetical protein